MADNIDRCPICAEPFTPDDICATDIEMGTCHAACLEGSPVVDLDTGDQLPDGKIDTYPYSEVMDPAPHDQVLGWHVMSDSGCSDITDRQDIADQWIADGFIVTPLVAALAAEGPQQ